MNRTSVFAISLLLVACSGDDGPSDRPGDVERETFSLPETAFSGEYSSGDFSLAESVDYWEVRRGPMSISDDDEFERVLSFDPSTYKALDDTQKAIIQETRVQSSGFGAQCQPLYCPLYAVSLSGYDAMAIDSDPQLMAFFGGIDTEAELFVYLTYAQNYKEQVTPLAFEANAEGYRVHVAWDSLCLVGGEDLIQVSPDGTIEKLEELSREETGVCV